MFGFFQSSLQTTNSVVANRNSCSHTVLAGTFHNTFEDRKIARWPEPQGLRNPLVFDGFVREV